MSNEYSDTIFDEGGQYIDALAYSYMHEFVKNTQFDSDMSRYLCYSIDQHAYGVGLGNLSNDFPNARQLYNTKQATINKKRRPLLSEKKAVEKKLREINKTPPEKLNEEQRSNLAEYNRDREELIEALSEIPRPTHYRPRYKKNKSGNFTKVLPKDWDQLKSWLKKEARKENPNNHHLIRNSEEFCQYLGLNELEIRVFTLFIAFQKSNDLKRFIDKISFEKLVGYNHTFAKMLDISVSDYQDLFEPESALVRNGLIVRQAPEDRKEKNNLPKISDHVIRILDESDANFNKIRHKLIGDPITTDLDWDRDFSHLGQVGQDVEALIKGTRENGEIGVNILFHGLQDTGKTEAAKALCKKLGYELYSVGEALNSNGAEPSREDRIAAALMAQSLLADNANAVVLFDEMEDALPQASSGLMALLGGETSGDIAGSGKKFLNNMLEQNATPTIWTANNPEQFHAAVRRRKRYSIKFDVPPANVRTQLWLNIAQKYNFTLSEEQASDLGKSYKAPPGMIATAIRNGVTMNGDIDTIKRSLEASATIVFGGINNIQITDTAPDHYNPALVNAIKGEDEIDINKLTKQMVDIPAKDFSLLLFGPPGTGKSAYSRYLAAQLGMEVMFKRSSDLESPYVGETEQKIAEAFRQAANNNLFLIIDEADSFLEDRRYARQSWEKTKVNEVLTHLEHHPVPCAFTTNLVDNIDQAAKRRFELKVKFDYLGKEQSNAAFLHFFDAAAPTSLQNVEQLTPGDFHVVKKGMRLDTHAAKPQELVERLDYEVRMKNEIGRRIGF